MQSGDRHHLLRESSQKSYIRYDARNTNSKVWAYPIVSTPKLTFIRSTRDAASSRKRARCTPGFRADQRFLHHLTSPSIRILAYGITNQR